MKTLFVKLRFLPQLQILFQSCTYSVRVAFTFSIDQIIKNFTPFFNIEDALIEGNSVISYKI